MFLPPSAFYVTSNLSISIGFEFRIVTPTSILFLVWAYQHAFQYDENHFYNPRPIQESQSVSFTRPSRPGHGTFFRATS